MASSLIWHYKTALLFCTLTFGISIIRSQTPEQKYISLNEAITFMLNNNPHAKNARLLVELSEAGKNSAFEIHPTTFTYYYGQLNTSVNDRYFKINQNFGSPLSHYYKDKINKADLNQAKTQHEITTNDLTAQVKGAWFGWVFAQNKLALIEEVLKIYEESAGQFFDDSVKTTIDSSSIAALQNRYADIQNRNFQASQDYKLATNQMKRLLFTTDNIVPADTMLEMYAINPRTSGPDKFYPATHIQLYDQHIQLKKWETGYERGKLFPEITAGYFNQQIENVKGFEGIMIGLAVPIWFFPQKTKIKQALINHNIAKNEREYHEFELELRIENLKIELDKLFVQISFFTENVLKQADQQEQSLLNRYKINAIAPNEFFDAIHSIYSKRLEFLTIIKQYNQTAVELEFLIR